MATNETIKSEMHTSHDRDGIRIVTDVQRRGLMSALDYSVMGEVRDKIVDKIVEAFMAEHGGELLASLKLTDIKELAMIKLANRLNTIFAEGVTR